MPAVNPTRLRFQIDELMQYFATPLEFHQRLRDLFSFYANRALRYGDSTDPKPLIPMYNLPAPVGRQLHIDLNLIVPTSPDAALSLVDELWDDSYYEVKQTALYILGIIPFDSPSPIINRLREWLSPNLDAVMVRSLFALGTRRIQEEFPENWEQFINSYLEKNNLEDQSIGLKGLAEGLKKKNFSNLPTVFRLLSPIIHNPDRKQLRDLENLIQILSDQSPIETAHFLRQTLSLSTSPETKRLVKQCLQYFPERTAEGLKTLLE